MNDKSLQNKVLSLLENSSIPAHDKEMVRILLPVMEDADLKDIFETLSEENSKTFKLDEKQKRIELKYKIMIENLVKTSKKTD